MSNEDSATDGRTECVIREGSCAGYAPGHNMHFIHANHIGRTPWGWRDGVVTALHPDGWIDVAYVAEQGSVSVHHHADLSDELQPGDPVRVHEQYWALAVGGGWLNVAVRDGLGAVPEPEHPETWAAEMTVGVVHLRTGRAVATDRPSDADEE